MADDERAKLIERVNLQRQVEAKRAASGADPAQPGIQAIGSNASPGEDWVDKAKALPGKIAQTISGSKTIQRSHPLLALAMEPHVQDIAARIQNLLGGTLRTGAAAAAGAIKPGENPVTSDDVMNTLVGQAPGSAEYLKRFGTPDMGNVSIPGTNKHLTGRDILGGGLDVGSNVIPMAALSAFGPSIYASGNKKLDLVAKRYGKESPSGTPVTDVLKKYGMRGSEAKRQQFIDDLGDKFAGDQAAVEKAGTKAGGEVDMNVATSHAQEVVDGLKKDYTVNGKIRPDMAKVINRLQEEIDTRKSMGAVESQKSLVELPYTEEKEVPVRQSTPLVYKAPTEGTIETSTNKTRLDAKGKPVVNYQPPRPQGEVTVKKVPGQEIVNDSVDTIEPGLPVGTRMEKKLIPRTEVGEVETDRLPGPTLTQGRKWKSADAAKADYEAGISHGLRDQFDKAMASGHRAAVEQGVGESLGPESQQKYSDTNSDWGKILTSKERARLDAEIEARKNTLTQVKAGAIAEGPTGMRMALMAHLAKLLNKVDARTTIGYNLEKSAPALKAGAAGAALSPKQNPWSP